MLRDGMAAKRRVRLFELWASPEAWLLAASIVWCAALACGLAYVILATAL